MKGLTHKQQKYLRELKHKIDNYIDQSGYSSITVGGENFSLVTTLKYIEKWQILQITF